MCSFHSDREREEGTYIMMAVRGSGSLFRAAIVSVIISTFRTVSSIEDKNMSKYRKFLLSNESSLPFGWNVEVESQRSKILATTVNRLLARYLSDEKLLYIITGNDMEYDSLTDFFKVGSTSVITVVKDKRNFDMPCVVYQKPSGYLLMGIDFSEIIEPLINFTIIGSSWNPRGLYITIAQSKKEAANIMTSLRKKFVYKIVVLVIHNDPLYPMIEAYTWRPYHPLGNCGPPTQESLIRLGTLTETSNFKTETNIWPGMMPTNFGNCPLNISYNIWEPYVLSPEEEEASENVSLEVVLIELVCGKIGVKVNRRFHLNISEMKKSEAIAGAVIAASRHLKLYDVSIPYVQDSLGWFVPRKYKRRALFSLNENNFPTFKALTVIAMCFAAASLMAAGSRHWALSVWGSFWDQSNLEVPNKVRGIWCCWLLICLHLTTIYRTALLKNFSNPFVERVIKDQSDLLKSGLKLSFLNAAEIYFDKEDELDRKILEQYMPCDSVPKCYKEIPTGRAVFTNKMLTQYLNGRKDVPNSLVETVGHLPPSLTYELSMLYVKGHAMFPAFNKFILIAIEAGFVEYWLKRIEVIQASTTVRKLNYIAENRYLTLHDVRRAFNLLAIGLSIAGVLFLGEIFYHCFLQSKR